MFSSFEDWANCDPCGLQKIFDDGTKKFIKNSHLAGSFYVIGNIENPEKIMICEGLATGLSIHLASRIPVIVSFNAGNLEPVAKAAFSSTYKLHELLSVSWVNWKSFGGLIFYVLLLAEKW
jgi:putative DNA primase/helicase